MTEFRRHDERPVQTEQALVAHAAGEPTDLSAYRLVVTNGRGRAFVSVGTPPMESLVGTYALDSDAWADLKTAVAAAGGDMEGAA